MVLLCIYNVLHTLCLLNNYHRHHYYFIVVFLENSENDVNRKLIKHRAVSPPLQSYL